MVFSASVAATVTGVRWYAPTTAVSGPIGSLWAPTAANPAAATGSQLVSKTFGAITPGAWNSVLFDTPVPISANTPYTAVVWTPANYTFSSPDPWPLTNGHLTAYSSAAAGNGRFQNGAASGSYPSSGSAGFNFFVDVLVVAQSAVVGLVTETDTALPLGRGKSRALGVATETDIAVAFGTGLHGPVGARIVSTTRPGRIVSTTRPGRITRGGGG
jgi:hypothetical protein